MRSRSDRMTAFIMFIPTIIVITIFVYIFIGQAIQTSTSDWGMNLSQPPLAENVVITDVGLQNYETIMTDLLEFSFRNSLANTFFFTVFFVGGCLAAGLILALLLDQDIFGEAVFRTVFLFPMSLSFVVTGTIWRWMLQPEGGINLLWSNITGQSIDNAFSWMNSRDVWLPFEWGEVPRLLTFLGLAIMALFLVRAMIRGHWRTSQYIVGVGALLLILLAAGAWDYIWLPLDDPETEPFIAPKGFNAALLGIIIAAVWQMSGYTMAMFLAGIRGIPDELREAARVDGCSEIGVYRHIILPQLNPIILSAMIILGHISLKIFDLVFAMAGPDNAQTVVPGLLVYTEGFRENAFAKASAIAVIMLFFVALIIIPYLWSQLREEK